MKSYFISTSINNETAAGLNIDESRNAGTKVLKGGGERSRPGLDMSSVLGKNHFMFSRVSLRISK